MSIVIGQLQDSDSNAFLPVSAQGDAGTYNGYQKCADGTLIQWGVQSVSVGTMSATPSGDYYAQVSIPLHTAFINAVYAITATSKYGSGHQRACGCVPQTGSQASVAIVDYYDRSNSTFTVRWMAIGRWK